MNLPKKKKSVWDDDFHVPSVPVTREEKVRALLDVDDVKYTGQVIPKFIIEHDQFRNVDLKMSMFQEFSSQRVNNFVMEDFEPCMHGWPQKMNNGLFKMCMYIRSLDAFRAYSNTQIISFLRIMTLHTYHRGDTIFSEGEFSTGFYILLAGEVGALSPGTKQVLRVLTCGQTFGDSAASIESARLFTACALTKNTVVGYFSRNGFTIRNRDAQQAETKEVVKFLSEHVAPFAGVSAKDLYQIARLSSVRRLSLGSIVFDDSLRGNALVILLSGAAKIFKRVSVTEKVGLPIGKAEIERIHVTRIVSSDEGEAKPGSFFGHGALLVESDAGVVVIACEEGAMLQIPSAIFRRYVNGSPLSAFIAATQNVTTAVAARKKLYREKIWEKIRVELATTAVLRSTRSVPINELITKAHLIEEDIINRMVMDSSKPNLQPPEEVVSVDVMTMAYRHITQKKKRLGVDSRNNYSFDNNNSNDSNLGSGLQSMSDMNSRPQTSGGTEKTKLRESLATGGRNNNGLSSVKSLPVIH